MSTQIGARVYTMIADRIIECRTQNGALLFTIELGGREATESLMLDLEVLTLSPSGTTT